MSDLNRIEIIGRLGKDPELKTSSAGLAICKFSVATSERVKEKDVTQWHNVTVFGKVAEACAKFLFKGSQVFVDGRMDYHKYTGQDGIERTSAGIIANHVIFLGDKKGGGVAQGRIPAQPAKPQPAEQYNLGTDDDIPF